MHRAYLHRVAPFVVVAMLSALLFACGDDDAPPEAQEPTPSATATDAAPEESPTATATPPDVTTPEPTPIMLDPELPDGAAELGAGSRNLTLEPGVATDLDPLQAARDAGIEPPACAAFVFAFAWGADGPGASDLLIEGLRQGVVNELGAGPAGEAAVGCVLLRFTAPDRAFVDISFLAGELE